MSLIVSRRIKESVIIGDNEIRVTVLAVDGNQVKLSIDAPRHIPVHREEVYIRAKEAGTL